MAVRASMAELIARVRRLIADPSGASATFTDQDVQDALDRGRADLYALPLTAATATDFWADRGPWEADEALTDGSGATVTATTAERLVGHWEFGTAPAQPLAISGKVYDLYGAAAELLEAWAAQVKLEFDFTASGDSFKRSQKREALLELAQMYRRQAAPRSVPAGRSDLVVEAW